MRIGRVAGWSLLVVAVGCGGGGAHDGVTTDAFDASRDAITGAVVGRDDGAAPEGGALEGGASVDGSVGAVVLSAEAGPSQRSATPEAECLYVSTGCLCALRGEHCDAVRRCCGGYDLACSGNGVCDILGPN